VTGRAGQVARRSHAGRKAHRVRARLDATRETVPTPRQLDYLRALGVGARSVLYLAARLEVGPHAAGEMVRRLEAAGWVAPFPARRPRRFKVVQLTGPGVTACLMAGVRAFVADMREQGIHVGFGNPARCVVCDVPYPCAAAHPDGVACLTDEAGG
jgi:hypothetical protein